jgi:hypothetical protein
MNKTLSKSLALTGALLVLIATLQSLLPEGIVEFALKIISSAEDMAAGLRN